MEVILIRHGQTFWNQRGLIQGNIDVGLNQHGEQQARNVGRTLPQNQAYDLAVSPLRRAWQTAEILRELITVKNYWIEEQLREFDQGYWNGLPGERVKESLDSQLYRDWQADPIELSPPNGETFKQVEQRVSRALELILEKTEHPLIIVGHKVINSVIAALAGCWPLEQVLDRLPENAGLVRVEF